MSNVSNRIIGQKFSRLTVIKQSGRWCECICECGNKVEYRTDKIKDGSRKSCGCIMVERNAAAHAAALVRKAPAPRPKRPMQNPDITRMKRLWATMMQRCYNTNCRSYPYYGARGITVDARWHNRDAFLFDMSHLYRHGLWIERTDNTLGYGPDNCTFVTPYRQSCNRANTLYVVLRSGRKCPLAMWAARSGLPYARVYSAYARLALSGPVSSDSLRSALPSRGAPYTTEP